VETTLRENTVRDARMDSLVILSTEDSAPGVSAMDRAPVVIITQVTVSALPRE